MFPLLHDSQHAVSSNKGLGCHKTVCLVSLIQLTIACVPNQASVLEKDKATPHGAVLVIVVDYQDEQSSDEDERCAYSSGGLPLASFFEEESNDEKRHADANA